MASPKRESSEWSNAHVESTSPSQRMTQNSTSAQGNFGTSETATAAPPADAGFPLQPNPYFEHTVLDFHRLGAYLAKVKENPDLTEEERVALFNKSARAEGEVSYDALAENSGRRRMGAALWEVWCMTETEIRDVGGMTCRTSRAIDDLPERTWGPEAWTIAAMALHASGDFDDVGFVDKSNYRNEFRHKSIVVLPSVAWSTDLNISPDEHEQVIFVVDDQQDDVWIAVEYSADEKAELKDANGKVIERETSERLKRTWGGIRDREANSLDESRKAVSRTARPYF
ncbi:hypothetical protein K491DRAFT_762740 [Lophiostoma macrostomum CBS 122681]|uniref:Uncharacterized protein n=1 Tax=Lophiostoma macrostomum CBS 122681 TaxID=1314788 RepID=A0A6A6SM59_9PLEO|nr:hypothetical protein K491DRAFT_762740 [Lophiostoma macrostomum CBS 122681]